MNRLAPYLLLAAIVASLAFALFADTALPAPAWLSPDGSLPIVIYLLAVWFVAIAAWGMYCAGVWAIAWFVVQINEAAEGIVNAD